MSELHHKWAESCSLSLFCSLPSLSDFHRLSERYTSIRGLGHFGRGHLGRGHYSRGHLGRGHYGRVHLGGGHYSRGHFGRGQLGRGHFGPLI